MPDPSSSEVVLLIEMLERIADALHREVRAPRMTRHNIGAHANTLRFIARQLRAHEPSQGGTSS